MTALAAHGVALGDVEDDTPAAAAVAVVDECAAAVAAVAAAICRIHVCIADHKSKHIDIPCSRDSRGTQETTRHHRLRPQ